MKEFQKVQMIAKNLPTGSYAAGCPVKGIYSVGGDVDCKECESSK